MILFVLLVAPVVQTLNHIKKCKLGFRSQKNALLLAIYIHMHKDVASNESTFISGDVIGLAIN
jgi:hypothetical protein